MKHIIKRFSTNIRTTLNFKSGISPLTKLFNELPQRDAVMVGSQNIKWTASELNTYSDAFARHLIEVGCQPSQKFLIWSDVNHSSEIICATIGAWKAGLSVVHSEYENADEIKKIIDSENIEVLMFSPYEKINGITRLSHLEGFSKIPNHTIQISHSTIDNMIKFKQAFNYGSGFNTSIILPEISESHKAFEIIKSSGNTTFTHGELYQNISSFETNFKYENVLNSAPSFYPISISLGLLGNMLNKNYVVIPGTYSLKEILNLVKNQKSKQFICEGNLLDLNTNEERIKDISSKTLSVEEVVIFGDGNEIKSKSKLVIEKCFPNAKINLFDEFSMKRI